MVQNLHDSKKPEQQSARTMNSEQFTCIVEAIVEGKYSWACVLILRFAGYNPAHYIPYRTYKRLLKENRRKQKVDVCKPDSDWSSAATEKNCSLQVMRHPALPETKEPSRTMNSEQFTCIVEAIVEGKYSWACVLILRFAGYNPAHYIPYRTYKRLLKENRRQKAEVYRSESDRGSSVATASCFSQAYSQHFDNTSLLLN